MTSAVISISAGYCLSKIGQHVIYNAWELLVLFLRGGEQNFVYFVAGLVKGNIGRYHARKIAGYLSVNHEIFRQYYSQICLTSIPLMKPSSLPQMQIPIQAQMPTHPSLAMWFPDSKRNYNLYGITCVPQ